MNTNHQQVKASSGQPSFGPEFFNEMKQMLMEARSQLEEELKGLRAHTEIGDDLDENAEEIQVDEASRSLMLRIKSDLEKIDKALAKIEDGTYGVDDDGRAISEERLRALPWADKAI